MCGICGKINFNESPVEEELLRKMCSTMGYRGPDDSGVYISKEHSDKGDSINIGLGHQRLSIIDLSPSGHQPMTNEDGTIWITYNGEIYNFKSIRSKLIKKGHKFTSNTDTALTGAVVVADLITSWTAENQVWFAIVKFINE